MTRASILPQLKYKLHNKNKGGRERTQTPLDLAFSSFPELVPLFPPSFLEAKRSIYRPYKSPRSPSKPRKFGILSPSQIRRQF